jgi:hypothetical protein
MKKLVFLLLTLAVFLSDISCSSPRYEDNAASFLFNPETDADNRYLNAPCCITELDNAFIWHDYKSGYFYYYDKTSGDSGVLCNKPECEHNSNDCGGAPSAVPVVWQYDGKLYWLLSRTGKEKRDIYRMNPDSSEKELFMTIPEPESDGMLLVRTFFHRGKVFLEWRGKMVRGGVPMERYRLTVCDYETHDASKQKPVLEFEAFDSLSGNVLAYCAGDKLYLLSNHTGEEYEIIIWEYDINEEQLSVVADIPADDDEFYTRSFKVTPEGDIYVGQLGFYEEHITKAYKIEDNQLVDFMAFEDDDFNGGTVFVCDEVIIAVRFISEDSPEHRVWVKDYDGNTVYKGELTANFGKGDTLPLIHMGFEYTGADRSRILFMVRELRGTSSTVEIVYFIEYDITESGLVEKTLVRSELGTGS